MTLTRTMAAAGASPEVDPDYSHPSFRQEQPRRPELASFGSGRTESSPELASYEYSQPELKPSLQARRRDSQSKQQLENDAMFSALRRSLTLPALSIVIPQTSQTTKASLAGKEGENHGDKAASTNSKTVSFLPDEEDAASDDSSICQSPSWEEWGKKKKKKNKEKEKERRNSAVARKAAAKQERKKADKGPNAETMADAKASASGKSAARLSKLTKMPPPQRLQTRTAPGAALTPTPTHHTTSALPPVSIPTLRSHSMDSAAPSPPILTSPALSAAFQPWSVGDDQAHSPTPSIVRATTLDMQSSPLACSPAVATQSPQQGYSNQSSQGDGSSGNGPVVVIGDQAGLISPWSRGPGSDGTQFGWTGEGQEASSPKPAQIGQSDQQERQGRPRQPGHTRASSRSPIPPPRTSIFNPHQKPWMETALSPNMSVPDQVPRPMPLRSMTDGHIPAPGSELVTQPYTSGQIQSPIQSPGQSPGYSPGHRQSQSQGHTRRGSFLAATASRMQGASKFFRPRQTKPNQHARVPAGQEARHVRGVSTPASLPTKPDLAQAAVQQPDVAGLASLHSPSGFPGSSIWQRQQLEENQPTRPVAMEGTMGDESGGDSTVQAPRLAPGATGPYVYPGGSPLAQQSVKPQPSQLPSLALAPSPSDFPSPPTSSTLTARMPATPTAFDKATARVAEPAQSSGGKSLTTAYRSSLPVPPHPMHLARGEAHASGHSPLAASGVRAPFGVRHIRGHSEQASGNGSGGALPELVGGEASGSPLVSRQASGGSSSSSFDEAYTSTPATSPGASRPQSSKGMPAVVGEVSQGTTEGLIVADDTRAYRHSQAAVVVMNRVSLINHIRRKPGNPARAASGAESPGSSSHSGRNDSTPEQQPLQPVVPSTSTTPQPRPSLLALSAARDADAQSFVTSLTSQDDSSDASITPELPPRGDTHLTTNVHSQGAWPPSSSSPTSSESDSSDYSRPGSREEEATEEGDLPEPGSDGVVDVSFLPALKHEPFIPTKSKARKSRMLGKLAEQDERPETTAGSTLHPAVGGPSHSAVVSSAAYLEEARRSVQRPKSSGTVLAPKSPRSASRGKESSPRSGSMATKSMVVTPSFLASVPSAIPPIPALPSPHAQQALELSRRSLVPAPGQRQQQQQQPQQPLQQVVPAGAAAKFRIPSEDTAADRIGQQVAKMLVECCSCRFFHDMPSRVYECMVRPDAMVEDRTLGISGAITTMVKCPWCSHNMSTSCCAGYATVIQLKERLH